MSCSSSYFEDRNFEDKNNEIRWDYSGQILCVFEWKLLYVYRDDVPKKCPYRLEHVLQTQTEENKNAVC
jgi:hypothetical protein